MDQQYPILPQSLNVTSVSFERHMDNTILILAKESKENTPNKSADTLTIYSDGIKIIPVEKHLQFDLSTANEICKQVGLEPEF